MISSRSTLVVLYCSVIGSSVVVLCWPVFISFSSVVFILAGVFSVVGRPDMPFPVTFTVMPLGCVLLLGVVVSSFSNLGVLFRPVIDLCVVGLPVIEFPVIFSCYAFKLRGSQGSRSWNPWNRRCRTKLM
jgi:hypothetical protein